jgi:D-amino-acid dehydrogenase
MDVLVLGGGVIGVTSAYFLAKAGHEVTVVDRQPSVGLETSFANAGQISPGYSAPWAAPGIPAKALKWMLMRHRPLVLWPRPDPRLYLWLAQMLANCNAEAYRLNKSRMVRIAEYSRDKLRDLRNETSIAYDHREQGTLQLFRSQRQIDALGDDLKVLDETGVAYELLDAAGCVAAEPGLGRVRGKISGGLRLPGDETGDAYLFTERLAAICARMGVRFLINTPVDAIEFDADHVSGVRIRTGQILRARNYVVAMGSYSAGLLEPLGISLPIYPVKGYSLTLPIADAEASPVSTVMDETFKIAITRLGDRIRVGGTAELAGFSLSLREPRRNTLLRSLRDLFPDGGDLKRGTFWSGLRPMTPDGTPVVGGTRLGNLYTNTGHGTLGWTMACGSACILADLINGKSPEIDHRDLSVGRYRRAKGFSFKPQIAARAGVR